MSNLQTYYHFKLDFHKVLPAMLPTVNNMPADALTTLGSSELAGILLTHKPGIFRSEMLII